MTDKKSITEIQSFFDFLKKNKFPIIILLNGENNHLSICDIKNSNIYACNDIENSTIQQGTNIENSEYKM